VSWLVRRFKIEHPHSAERNQGVAVSDCEPSTKSGRKVEKASDEERVRGGKNEERDILPIFLPLFRKKEGQGDEGCIVNNDYVSRRCTQREEAAIKLSTAVRETNE
jgi:hypothetical protein